MMKKYNFSIDFWNEYHYRNFEKIAIHFRSQQSVNILEVGTFEGRTAFWLLDNIPNAKVTVIDPNVHEPNFSNNFKEWSKENDVSRFNWKCDYSFPSLLEEYAKGNQYDFIYIDGCHNACCVLEDAVLAWKILKTGGILLLDDYNMKVEDNWFYISHKEFETYKENGCMFIHPREGINAFLSLYKGQYEVFINNYQIGVIKLAQLDKINLNHGDNTQRSIYEKNERTT